MQGLVVLADATIWIRYFRNHNASVNDHLEKFLTEGAVRICGVILAEIMQGAKSEDELHLIHSLLQAVPYLEDFKEDWEQAALLVYQLRKKGITLTLSDCLIAALSRRYHCSVFSLDKDFDRIPNLKLVKI